MRSRLLTILVTLGILLVVGAASVYAGSLILRTSGSANAPGALPVAQGAPGVESAPATQERLDKGLLVIGVLPGSPALQAGIHRGCIILAADEREVNAPEQLDRMVTAHKVGDTLALTLTYCAGVVDTRITLIAAPGSPDEQAPAAGRAWLGVVVSAPIQGNPQAPGSEGVPGNGGDAGAAEQGVSASPVFFFNETGAVGLGIVGVTPGSPAAQAGLQPGDVITTINGQARFDPRTALQRVAQAKPGDTLELSVVRAGRTQTLRITLGARPGQPDSAYLGVYAWSTVGR